MPSERSTSTMEAEPGRSITWSRPAPPPGLAFAAGFSAACAVTVVAAIVAAAPFRNVRRSLMRPPPLLVWYSQQPEENMVRYAAAALALLCLASQNLFAQAEPLKIGFLTVRTGPLAAGGRQMEEGINLFLKERNYTLAGRKVEILFADTAGQPAQAKTKAQELVERDKVHVLVGPLATFE